jgi:hypothetical protein
MLVSNNAGMPAMLVHALTQMDAWLAAIQADTDGGSQAAKVIRNRPATLSDACWTSATTRIDEPFGLGLGGTCAPLYPAFGDTRLAAGEGLADDTLKCRLKPIDFDSYGVAFTAEQQARLRATFPTGVCDWSKEASCSSLPKAPGSTSHTKAAVHCARGRDRVHEQDADDNPFSSTSADLYAQNARRTCNK